MKFYAFNSFLLTEYQVNPTCSSFMFPNPTYVGYLKQFAIMLSKRQNLLPTRQMLRRFDLLIVRSEESDMKEIFP
jgi:hypothetical protein